MKVSKLKVLIHLAIWVLVIILPWFMMTGNLEQPGFMEGRYYLRLLNGGLLFYLTYMILVPKFYLKDKKLSFYVYATIAIAVFYGATELASQWLFPDDLLKQRLDLIMEKVASEGFKFSGPSPAMRYFNSAFISVLVVILALGLRVTDAYAEKEKERRELEKEKLASELGMLKSQINPHFFFNTLNNIYALTESDNHLAGIAVLKLSKMMRYVLYESELGNTTLEQEVGFMNHFIDLMRLRLSEKVAVRVDFRPHSGEISIAPMIFISFIENAFKHGVSYREPSFVEISLVTTPHEIAFHCRNSNFSHKTDQTGEASGIGLENIRKRLTLLYPDKHILKITETPQTYDVSLTIQLQES